MSKIFFEFSRGLGPLMRCLPIINRLRALGHHIMYFGHPECRSYMEKLNYQHIDIDVVMNIGDGNKKKNNWVNADEFWGSFGFDNQDFLKTELAVWIEKVQEFNPDIIVSDLGVFSSLVARILEIPLATVTQSCYHPRAMYKPQRYWGKNQSVCTESLEAINCVLKNYHAPLLYCFEEIFAGDITIIPGFPEFDKLTGGNGKKDKVYYVGPILWEGFKSESTFQLKQSDKIRIFCYGGQLIDYAGKSGLDLLTSIINMINDNDMEAIISTGSAESATRLSAQNPYQNIQIVDWMPIEEAYSKCNLVICHGGHGSCMGLFQFMVPGLILPTHSEREYNARLVEELGVGISIPYEKFSKERVRRAIVSILEDPSYMSQVKNYHDLINMRYKRGEILAADYILSLSK